MTTLQNVRSQGGHCFKELERMNRKSIRAVYTCFLLVRSPSLLGMVQKKASKIVNEAFKLELRLLQDCSSTMSKLPIPGKS